MAAKQAWTILWTLGFILMLEVMITTANLSQLASMISCSTKNPWIKYTSYGCYCGPGGEGTPLDNVDRCCQTHDGCYNHVMTSNECKYSIEVYLDEYKYTGCNKCAPNQSKCHLDICECDSKIAKCLEGKPLNTRYIGYEKAKCSKEYRRYYEFTGKDYYKDDTEIDVD